MSSFLYRASKKNDLLSLTRILKISAAIVAFSATLQFSLYSGGLWINLTSSMPQGIYRQHKDRILHTGDHVLSCIPRKAALEAYARGYLGYGSCSEHTAPVGKKIVAQIGDHVKIDESGISVNGKRLSYTRPSTHDGHGAALEYFAMDRMLVQNELLLASQAFNSFDSRYFGVVNNDSLRGVLTPVYLF